MSRKNKGYQPVESYGATVSTSQSETSPIFNETDRLRQSSSYDEGDYKGRSRSRSSSFYLLMGEKKLGLAAFVVLTFYSVSGGPFGIEDIVRAGGPFFALCGFSLMLVWAVPEAMITAELSTAIPEASGSVAWVEAAFGPFWAFQKGWLNWLSGVADNALYPILFLDCLLAVLTSARDNSTTSDAEYNYDDIYNIYNNSSNSTIYNSISNSTVSYGDDGESLIDILSNDRSWYRVMVIVGITMSLTYLSYRGIECVGYIAIGICIFSLSPFVAFCIIGSFKIQPARWLVTPPGGIKGVQWRLLFNTFFWNINFWESSSSFAGDVEDPGSTYPRGMLIALLMVFLASFLPILIGTGASSDSYTEWTDGYFLHIAAEIGGPWLSYWMMLAAATTNIGMFEAEMSSDAWQVCGMAERGILPKFLSRRNKYGTPLYGTMLSATGVVCLGTLAFSEVIYLVNLLFCLGQAIEFCAFLHLRRVKPDMPRPFKIGIGLVGMSIILSFPLIFIILIIAFSTLKSILLAVCCVCVGVILYHGKLLQFHYHHHHHHHYYYYFIISFGYC